MCQPVNHVDLGRHGSGHHRSHPDLMGQPDLLFCLLGFKSDCVFVTLKTVVGDIMGDDFLACDMCDNGHMENLIYFTELC